MNKVFDFLHSIHECSNVVYACLDEFDYVEINCMRSRTAVYFWVETDSKKSLVRLPFEEINEMENVHSSACKIVGERIHDIMEGVKK